MEGNGGGKIANESLDTVSNEGAAIGAIWASIGGGVMHAYKAFDHPRLNK